LLLPSSFAGKIASFAYFGALFSALIGLSCSGWFVFSVTNFLLKVMGDSVFGLWLRRDLPVFIAIGLLVFGFAVLANSVVFRSQTRLCFVRKSIGFGFYRSGNYFDFWVWFLWKRSFLRPFSELRRILGVTLAKRSSRRKKNVVILYPELKLMAIVYS
jgi:hypothetical protein